LFFATNRNVVETVIFDENLFNGFHMYDLDFSFSAYLKGFRLAVCNDITIIHYSGGNYDSQWNHYRDLFRKKYMAQLVNNQKARCPYEVVKLKSKEEIATYCEMAFSKK